MRKHITLFSAVITLSFIGIASLPAADGFSVYVDDLGKISLPKDFRQTMTHLGSWFVPEGDANGFHDVYADRFSVAAYRKTGRFPDGGILIKELRQSASGQYTTGANVKHATSVKQWFVMVKDSQNRFSTPNWGKGWGWALFKTNDTNKNISTDYKTDCLGCHAPASDRDWVYTEGYPTLFTNK